METPNESEPVRAALTSPIYEAAFRKAMRGQEALFTDEEREAVRVAKELTGTTGPGYPMPLPSNPTGSE